MMTLIDTAVFPSMQWAAVRTYFDEMRTPPQKGIVPLGDFTSATLKAAYPKTRLEYRKIYYKILKASID